MSDIRFDTWLHRTGSGGVYQDSSGRVGIGTSVPTSALSVVGVVSATGFVGDLSGNVVGNVTGNLNGNVTGQILGVQTSITVGDKFINSSGVGLGATDTTGRNAGVGTAVGTIIYNSSTGVLEYYNGLNWSQLRNNFDATGGTKTTSGGKTIHTFTGTGTFTVNYGSALVDYLVVAGGGGGGRGAAGGGGAGGFRTGNGFSVSPGAYTVTVGGGGAGQTTGFDPTSEPGSRGGPSWFGVVGLSTITSIGGGGGSSRNAGDNSLVPGGSGGGGGPSFPFGTGTPGEGNPGGTADPANNGCGGGGGASQVGANASGKSGGKGGDGTVSTISGSPVTYAGGGGGGANGDPPAGTAGPGGSGGGGAGSVAGATGTAGTTNLGGGGGGGGIQSGGIRGNGGSGGSGIVIIAYPS
jgi:hypothetical protein